MPYQQYKQMTVPEVQALMAHRHILITDMPTEPLGFDEDGLQVLKSLDARIEIQGQSPGYLRTIAKIVS